MQKQTISKLYIDDKTSKYSSNPNDILKICKKLLSKSLHQKVSKSAIDELLNKVPTNKKVSNKYFNFSEAEISLHEIIKAINSQKN